jgi:hypothetical protein
MNPHVEHPEPLPVEFSAAHRAIDARLAEAAELQELPVGLNARVFQASVSMLPHRRKSTRLRLVSAGQAAFQRLTLGRLAMAAMVLLSCSVAIWVLNSQHNMPDGGGMVARSVSLTPIDWMPQEATARIDRDLSYLLDTSDLTSPDDINHDLVMLVSELEM